MKRIGIVYFLDNHSDASLVQKILQHYSFRRAGNVKRDQSDTPVSEQQTAIRINWGDGTYGSGTVDDYNKDAQWAGIEKVEGSSPGMVLTILRKNEHVTPQFLGNWMVELGSDEIQINGVSESFNSISEALKSMCIFEVFQKLSQGLTPSSISLFQRDVTPNILLRIPCGESFSLFEFYNVCKNLKIVERILKGK